MNYAGFWIRAAAALIDGFIVSICVSLLHRLFGIMPTIHYHVYKTATSFETSAVYSSPEMVAPTILSAIFSWVYYAWFNSSSWQGTPGLRALDLRIVGYDNKRIGFGRATARYFSSFISMIIFFIGYLMIAFTSRKQALHDMIAHTLVLRSPKA